MRVATVIAEDVRGDPVEAGGSERVAQVGLGVGRVAPAAEWCGKHRSSSVASGHCSLPAGSIAQQVDAPAGEDQGASPGVGLGRLDRQPFAAHAHGGGDHLDKPAVEVDGLPGQPPRFPDAQTGGHQEGDEVGKVAGDGPVVVGECGA
jgi:hypothetical protein